MGMRLQNITITFTPGQWEPNIQFSIGATGGDLSPYGNCTIAQHHIDTLKSVVMNIQQSVDAR